jgi:hypothetical protein
MTAALLASRVPTCAIERKLLNMLADFRFASAGRGGLARQKRDEAGKFCRCFTAG